MEVITICDWDAPAMWLPRGLGLNAITHVLRHLRRSVIDPDRLLWAGN